ncbi:hypothetical protein FGO68_gene2219 [Halteria grandinella]|uniref:Uncharacterized protein n=1 Tax=Halteria grandinella TaxID=5974 RepID=A0A8J8NYC7_HALGN|nr:hypothetical protein FGO68_gene2219 [Halteria grandinella]
MVNHSCRNRKPIKQIEKARQNPSLRYLDPLLSFHLKLKTMEEQSAKLPQISTQQQKELTLHTRPLSSQIAQARSLIRTCNNKACHSSNEALERTHEEFCLDKVASYSSQMRELLIIYQLHKAGSEYLYRSLTSQVWARVQRISLIQG